MGLGVGGGGDQQYPAHITPDFRPLKAESHFHLRGRKLFFLSFKAALWACDEICHCALGFLFSYTDILTHATLYIYLYSQFSCTWFFWVYVDGQGSLIDPCLCLKVWFSLSRPLWFIVTNQTTCTTTASGLNWNRCERRKTKLQHWVPLWRKSSNFSWPIS